MCRVKRDQILNGIHPILERENDHKIYIDQVLLNSESIVLRNGDRISLFEEKYEVFMFFNDFHKYQKDYPVELCKQYAILKMIAEGGFGVVYQAYRFKDSQLCAVKKCLKENTQIRSFLDKEKKLLQQVDHPCIIKLYNVVDDDKALYLVMELADRGEMPDKRLSEKVRLNVTEIIFIYEIFLPE